jgi:hypothetical protein
MGERTVKESELISKFSAKFGRNIMTPDIIGYQVSGNRVIELSEGRGMEGEKIFGVTIRDYKNGEWKEPNLSQMFHSMGKAQDYAREKMKKVI